MLEDTVNVEMQERAVGSAFSVGLQQRGLGGVFLRLAWSQGSARVVGIQQAGPLGLTAWDLHAKTLPALCWTAAELLPLDTPQERYLRLGGRNLHLMCGLVSQDGVALGWLGVSMEQGRHTAWRAFMAARDQLQAPARTTTSQSATLIICPHGNVELRCENAASWLGRDGFQEGLSAIVRSLQADGRQRHVGLLQGGSVRLEALSGRYLSRYLVHIDPISPLPLPVMAQLTDTQLQVSIYAAAGATVAEIARTLDRSENTVRSHLKLAYARLQISSRLELAQLVEQVWPSPAW